MEQLKKKVQKGVYITPEEIQSVTGVEKTDKNFAFAIMQVRGWVESEYDDLSCRSENNGLVICTDEQASEYNINLCANYFARIYHRNCKLNKVDTSEFDKGQKEYHDRATLVFGKILQSQELILKEHMPKLLPVTRNIKNMLQQSND